MILIAGLGNPEEKYNNTPHNIGFAVIDLFKEKSNFPEYSLFKNVLLSKKENIILIKPQTYMNNSGTGVEQVSSYFKIIPDNIWIIHDENKLNLGDFKINKDIPAFSHNGIKSIIEKLNSQNFVRFRIGINNGKEHNLADYVLKKFKKQDQEIIDQTISKIILLLDEAIQNGVEKII